MPTDTFEKLRYFKFREIRESFLSQKFLVIRCPNGNDTLKLHHPGLQSIGYYNFLHFMCTLPHLTPQRVVEREAPPLVVPYLSPVVLRKELETLITQDGSDVLGREGLVTSR